VASRPSLHNVAARNLTINVHTVRSLAPTVRATNATRHGHIIAYCRRRAMRLISLGNGKVRNAATRPPALGSLITAWIRYCTTNCIGSTFPTGFSSSWQWQFTSVSADTRRHLRSANRHLLALPSFQLNTYDRQAFSVAGLELYPRFYPGSNEQHKLFRRLLKTYLFTQY